MGLVNSDTCELPASFFVPSHPVTVQPVLELLSLKTENVCPFLSIMTPVMSVILGNVSFSARSLISNCSEVTIVEETI